jgi:periplasmic divalent cation tolerance protein
MTDKIIVLVTCGSPGEARKIGRSLVEQRLVACANIFRSPVHSIYRWKGKVESAKEFLVILKTSRRRFTAVERAIKSLHSYEVPEIVALPMADGSREYFDWISESVGGAGRKKN